MSVLIMMSHVPIHVSIHWEVIIVNVLLDLSFYLTIMTVKVTTVAMCCLTYIIKYSNNHISSTLRLLLLINH